MPAPNQNVGIPNLPFSTKIVDDRGIMATGWIGPLNVLWQRSAMTPPWIEDTHANRVNWPAANFISQAASYPLAGKANIVPNVEGGLYYETDRNVFYRAVMVANVPTWVYFSGEMFVTQATIPTGLGTADAGFLISVTDYGHRLRWSGSTWNWAPGEPGSGMMVLFEVDPTGVGWHLYDGTVGVNYLKADGTLGTITLPDLTSVAANAAYPKAGSPDSGPNASVPETGTVSQPTFTGAAMATHAHDAPVGDDGVNIYDLNVNGTGGTYPGVRAATSSAAGGNVVSRKTQAVSAGTPSGTVSQPTFTGNGVGEPRNIVRRPWFRM